MGKAWRQVPGHQIKGSIMKRPIGRPAGPEGTQKRFTVLLSPVQQKRALLLAHSVNKGVNEALRRAVTITEPSKETS
jgi:hypothetical protein